MVRRSHSSLLRDDFHGFLDADWVTNGLLFQKSDQWFEFDEIVQTHELSYLCFSPFNLLKVSMEKGILRVASCIIKILKIIAAGCC